MTNAYNALLFITCPLNHFMRNIIIYFNFSSSCLNFFTDHVLDLSRQSENKTLILFSTVYRRMSPLSRTPILELYKSIRR